MITMDVNGVSWVGNMCQRFEALCVDVDETIYEDTFIYVGNQMRTVGESVKKFYSEFMQDLRASSSVDSVKDKDPLVSVSHNDDAAIGKNQRLDTESGSVDIASEKTGKSSDGIATAKEFVKSQSQSQFDNFVSNKSTTVKKYFDNGQEQEPKFKSFSDSSCEDYVEEFTWESWNERDESLCESMDISSVIEASDVKVCESNENEVQISGDKMEGCSGAVGKGSQTKGTYADDLLTELDTSVSSMKAVVDPTVTENLRNPVEVGAGFSVCDIGVDKQGSLKHEESCVLVEKDDLFSKSTLDNVQKSYKKKIRDVFSPRRWSKPKRDQEPLASVRCEENLKSPTSELESEWELL